MDVKEPGNLLYLVGVTRDELGGSHFALVERPRRAGDVPQVDLAAATRRSRAVHAAIGRRLVRAATI